MTKPKTVRVRVAVAVDEHGNYSTGGESNRKDNMLIHDATVFMPKAKAIYFIEADVPLHAAETIKGEVK